MKSAKSSPEIGVLRRGAALITTLVLAACAVDFKNAQPAQQLAKLSTPPGAVYAGWRVFQDKCATCHGPAATGRAGGPDLLPSVREIGPRRFAALVLNRYDLGAIGSEPAKDSPGRAAWIDAVVQRKQGAMTMPVWEGEPSVSAHVMDLYAYVAARADGTQGPGRPPH